MPIVKREISGEKAFREVFEITRAVKQRIPERIKDYVDVEDFAPDWLQIGKEVVDPITGLRGEVIGYDERSILIPISEQ